MSRPRPCAPPRSGTCVTRSIISILRAHSLLHVRPSGPSTDAHVPGMWPASLSFCMSASANVGLLSHASMYGATSFWLANALARTF